MRITIGDALFSISGLSFSDAVIVSSIVMGSGEPPKIPQPDKVRKVQMHIRRLKLKEMYFTR